MLESLNTQLYDMFDKMDDSVNAEEYGMQFCGCCGLTSDAGAYKVPSGMDEEDVDLKRVTTTEVCEVTTPAHTDVTFRMEANLSNLKKWKMMKSSSGYKRMRKKQHQHFLLTKRKATKTTIQVRPIRRARANDNNIVLEQRVINQLRLQS